VAYSIDPVYFDDSAEMAVDQQKPGFMYMGSVEGEAPARARWNAQPVMEAPERPPDMGAAYARQDALAFAASKSAAEQERNIRESYMAAQTAQQQKAVQAAERNIAMNDINRRVAAGEPMADALMRNASRLSSGDFRNLAGTVPKPNQIYHVGDSLVQMDPTTGVHKPIYRQPPTRLPETARMELDAAYAARRAATMGLADQSKIASHKAYQKIIEDADSVIGRFQSGGNGASAAPATAAPRYQEGQTLRSKSTGKLYRVQNGVPVEIGGR
jgi:hypothetical protein